MDESLIKLIEELSKDPEIKEISLSWHDYGNPWWKTDSKNLKPKVYIKRFKQKK